MHKEQGVRDSSKASTQKITILNLLPACAAATEQVLEVSPHGPIPTKTGEAQPHTNLSPWTPPLPIIPIPCKPSAPFLSILSFPKLQTKHPPLPQANEAAIAEATEGWPVLLVAQWQATTATPPAEDANNSSSPIHLQKQRVVQAEESPRVASLLPVRTAASPKIAALWHPAALEHAGTSVRERTCKAMPRRLFL